MKRVLVTLLVIFVLAVEGAFIGVSFDTPWSIGALAGAMLAVYLLYKERVAEEARNAERRTAAARWVWRMWSETAFTLFVLTIGGSVVAEFFGFPWILGVLVGVIWTAVWFAREYLLQPTLEGVLDTVRDAASRVLDCLSGPDPHFKDSVEALSRALAELRNLAKKGSPDARAFLDRVPIISPGITNPNYIRVVARIAAKIAGEYLDTRTNPPKAAEGPKG